MALSADKTRNYKASYEEVNTLPVKGSATIYLGSAVSIASGYARALNTADSTDGFAGFAMANATNTSSTDGAINVTVKPRGIVTLTVTNVSGVGNINDAVYASDDGTFTTASTSNLQIGKVARWITSTTCEVYFEAAYLRSI